jgi:sugar/nucleoside kinase (ribokinase family)
MAKQLDVPLPQFNGRWITVAPPGSATTIALIPAHQGVPAGVETGIRLASPDAAAAHRQLQDRGVDVGELLRWDGVPPMFAFHDLDGNGLEIIQEAD